MDTDSESISSKEIETHQDPFDAGFNAENSVLESNKADLNETTTTQEREGSLDPALTRLRYYFGRHHEHAYNVHEENMDREYVISSEQSDSTAQGTASGEDDETGETSASLSESSEMAASRNQLTLPSTTLPFLRHDNRVMGVSSLSMPFVGARLSH
eukprot:IDg21098t1